MVLHVQLCRDMYYSMTNYHQWHGRTPGTKCGGTSCAGGLGDRSPPVGYRGEAKIYISDPLFSRGCQGREI